MPETHETTANQIDVLFLAARTHRRWNEARVEPSLLRRLYELARWPPTSANCQPMRLVLVTSADAKARLLVAVNEGNVEQTRTAPVTAIVAYDTRFFELMPKLVPGRPEMASRFAAAPEAMRDRLAFQSGTLQGAYLILAARLLGLDCGPMDGFDREVIVNWPALMEE